MQPERYDIPNNEAQVLAILEANQNGITKANLLIQMYGLSDPKHERYIRTLIRRLRDRGFVIVSASDHAGYKLTTDRAEIAHFVAEQVKRAKSCMRVANRVKKAYQMRDQLTIGLTS